MDQQPSWSKFLFRYNNKCKNKLNFNLSFSMLIDNNILVPFSEALSMNNLKLIRLKKKKNH